MMNERRTVAETGIGGISPIGLDEASKVSSVAQGLPIVRERRDGVTLNTVMSKQQMAEFTMAEYTHIRLHARRSACVRTGGIPGATQTGDM